MGDRRASNNTIVSIVLILILAAFIFFVPTYGWQVREWLSPSPNNGGTTGQTDNTSTIAENMVLQSQLDALQVMQSEIPTSSPGYVEAMVYSRYPLNFKNEITVNVGSKDGVAVGAGVIFQGVLIGSVKNIYPYYAVVQTVFDSGMKMPVRIGSKGIDGLLQGSADPIVGSISNTAPLTIGDVVYSAAPGLPYGVPIGTVAATSTSADSLFEQASLSFPYDLNTIQSVLVETSQ